MVQRHLSSRVSMGRRDSRLQEGAVGLYRQVDDCLWPLRARGGNLRPSSPCFAACFAASLHLHPDQLVPRSRPMPSRRRLSMVYSPRGSLFRDSLSHSVGEVVLLGGPSGWEVDPLRLSRGRRRRRGEVHGTLTSRRSRRGQCVVNGLVVSAVGLVVVELVGKFKGRDWGRPSIRFGHVVCPRVRQPQIP